MLNYPAHRAGLALLVLRCTVGLTLTVEAWRAAPPLAIDPTGAIAAFALIACGLALSLGVLSPLCSVIVALSHARAWLLATSGPTSSAAAGAALVGMAASLAVAILGPGAFSIDARLFGRRRIVIRGTRGGE